MFVHARVVEGVEEKAILIPQQAVTRDARGQASVLIVGADSKVQGRSIKTDRAIGDQWLVSEGIQAGDKVIVDGLQKIMPGIEVHVVEVGSGAGSQKNSQQK